MRTVPPARASRAITAAFLFVLWTCPAAPAQATAELTPQQVARIDAAVTALMSSKNIPGLSVAVVTDNRLRWSKTYGLADVEHAVPVKNETVFRLASTSKPLTAVAVMQLAEDGKIDLDAPVQKYVAAFPVKSAPITTRQLLGHLSGIRHYRGDEYDSTRNYPTLTDALAVFKDDPLEHEPGAKFTYTTYGYTLLGAAIEGASGMSYPDYMREHVFKAAGMAHTRIDSVFEIIPNRAHGYGKTRRTEGDLRNAGLTDTSYKIPGGGIVSTAEDLARFAIALQSGKLLKDETLGQMLARQKISDGTETKYGLGWFVGERDGKREAWHGGVQHGTTATLRLIPSERAAVAILTNLEGGGSLGLEKLSTEIADIALAPAGK